MTIFEHLHNIGHKLRFSLRPKHHAKNAIRLLKQLPTSVDFDSNHPVDIVLAEKFHSDQIIARSESQFFENYSFSSSTAIANEKSTKVMEDALTDAIKAYENNPKLRSHLINTTRAVHATLTRSTVLTTSPTNNPEEIAEPYKTPALTKQQAKQYFPSSWKRFLFVGLLAAVFLTVAIVGVASLNPAAPFVLAPTILGLIKGTTAASGLLSAALLVTMFSPSLFERAKFWKSDTPPPMPQPEKSNGFSVASIFKGFRHIPTADTIAKDDDSSDHLVVPSPQIPKKTSSVSPAASQQDNQSSVRNTLGNN